MLDFKETQKKIWGTNDKKELSAKLYKKRKWPFTDWKPFVATEFPYYRPDLPSPLPTDQEILSAKGTKDDLTKGLPCGGKVWRVRDYAVKWSFHPKLLQVRV